MSAATDRRIACSGRMWGRPGRAPVSNSFTGTRRHAALRTPSPCADLPVQCGERRAPAPSRYGTVRWGAQGPFVACALGDCRGGANGPWQRVPSKST